MLNKINITLENLFDQKSEPLINSGQNFSADQSNFQIINNNKMLENLSYIFSNEINHNNLSNLFTQLSSYFEIGFLLQKNDNSNYYYVKEAFIFAKKINPIEISKPIKLPPAELYKILSTNACSILNHFGLSRLDTSAKMISYLIPIAENFTIVVLTKTAEPWAKLKLESLQKTFMKINFYL